MNFAVSLYFFIKSIYQWTMKNLISRNFLSFFSNFFCEIICCIHNVEKCWKMHLKWDHAKTFSVKSTLQYSNFFSKNVDLTEKLTILSIKTMIDRVFDDFSLLWYHYVKWTETFIFNFTIFFWAWFLTICIIGFT